MIGRELFREREGDFHGRLLTLASKQHPVVASHSGRHMVAAGDLHCTRHKPITKRGSGSAPVIPPECIKPTEIDVQANEATLARVASSHFVLR